MSAPDLRVATTADLVAELERREQALRDGECDACGGQLWREPTCAYPARHDPKRENAVRPTGRLVLTGPRGCGKTTVADLYRRLAHHNGLLLEIAEVTTSTTTPD